jgi:predicted ATPase
VAVTGASAVQSRFEAQHATDLTPLVGREEELELLMRRWRQAASGEGRVVLLSGEPGIGKSRLTVALQERLQAEPHTRLRYFCSPQHTDSALYPIINQLERAAEFERHDTPAVKLDKLAALLGSSPGQERDLQLLAELLSIPTGEHYPSLDWSPQRKKDETSRALLRQLDMLSRKQPVMMIYEDTHWIDPSTRELLDVTVDRVPRLSALLVITFRPEFKAPWFGQSHVSTLSLSRLDRREGVALAASVAGNYVLSDAVIREIIERTDGVPLFVEELTKAMVETEARSGDLAGTLGRVPPPSAAVPATLNASLMARLDHLGPASKEVAQIGAAIGREFSYEVLAAVAQKSDAELRSALNRLTEAGLVFCRGTPPLASFLFKHALVRDVAYGSLLRGPRQQLHRCIADVLAAHSPTTVEVEPELLGYHYREAGMADAASAHFERAGDRAAARSTYIEAIAHFRASIEEAERLPRKDERTRRTLAVLLKLGPAVAVTIGEWKPEVEAVYRRARELGREVGEGPELFRATWGLWICANRKGGGQSRKWTEELTSIAGWLGDESLVLEAQHCRWGDELYGAANVQHLLEATAEGMRLYDPQRHAGLADAFGGHDPGVCALGCHATGLTLGGFPDQARRIVNKAITLAEFLSHPPSIAIALRMAGQGSLITHDRKDSERMGERLVALGEKFDLPISRWYGRFFIGWAKAQGSTLSESLAFMEEAFPLMVSEQGYKRDAAALAETRFDAGRVTDALALVDHALNTGDGPGSGLWVAEIHRLRAVFLKSLGSPTEEVERALRTAVEIADKQGAFLLKLRACVSLAHLWGEQGKRTEARDLLAPIYGWFTEGFDTPDLKEAKALLEELA